MPGLAGAKMEDVPEDGVEVLLLQVSRYLTNSGLESWGRIASGSSVSPIWKPGSLNL